MGIPEGWVYQRGKVYQGVDTQGGTGILGVGMYTHPLDTGPGILTHPHHWPPQHIQLVSGQQASHLNTLLLLTLLPINNAHTFCTITNSQDQ